MAGGDGIAGDVRQVPVEVRLGRRIVQYPPPEFAGTVVDLVVGYLEVFGGGSPSVAEAATGVEPGAQIDAGLAMESKKCVLRGNGRGRRLRHDAVGEDALRHCSALRKRQSAEDGTDEIDPVAPAREIDLPLPRAVLRHLHPAADAGDFVRVGVVAD